MSLYVYIFLYIYLPVCTSLHTYIPMYKFLRIYIYTLRLVQLDSGSYRLYANLSHLNLKINILIK